MKRNEAITTVKSQPLNVPVLFLIFNRVEQSRLVFAEIARQRPQKLYIAADGPRLLVQGEVEVCNETRQAILNSINWDCQLKLLFRETNLGCGKAVSSAIDWFFESENEGIILEDDCLADPCFFDFCGKMLQQYRDNENVLHISGNNFQEGNIRGDGSYYFSNLAHIWGWATWRRAWKLYDFTLDRYKDVMRPALPNKVERMIYHIQKGSLDTWDTQWFATVWWNRGLAICPQVNLIRNIGFGRGKGATHTKSSEPGWMKRMQYGSIDNVVHPTSISVDQKADSFTIHNVYTDYWLNRLIKKIIRR
ncbi:MAG: nucleotide-diphospho-sugar transferase [Bacteroidetes bacterium]|nr:nucleotide-diphospho-sugar transferase [Bacteroidota bacterium]